MSHEFTLDLETWIARTPARLKTQWDGVEVEFRLMIDLDGVRNMLLRASRNRALTSCAGPFTVQIVQPVRRAIE